MKKLFCIFGSLVVLAVLNSCADQSTNGLTSEGTLPTMTAPEHGPEYPSKTNYGHPGGM